MKNLEELASSAVTTDNRDMLLPLMTQLSNYLPGIYTFQKFCFLDDDPPTSSLLIEKYYRAILMNWLETWKGKTRIIENEIDIAWICPDSGVFTFYHSLSILLDFIAAYPLSSHIEYIENLLIKLFNSNSLPNALLSLSNSPEEKMIKIEIEIESWKKLVHSIINIPGRLANKFKGKINVCFIPKNFGDLLCSHILYVIQTLCEAHSQGFYFNIEPTAILLSKIIILYNDNRTSIGLISLLRIFSQMSQKSRKYATVIQILFQNLSRESIHIIALMILEHSSTKDGVKLLVGDILNFSAWKYVLTVKIPLRYFTCDHDSLILPNIFCYLLSLGNVENLKGLMFSLLDIWSSPRAIELTPLDQQIYIAKALILCSQSLFSLNTDHETILVIQKQLLQGVPAHLNSSLESTRAIGMLTAEIICHLIQQINSKNIKEYPKLSFQYEGISKETNCILNNLRLYKNYKFDPSPKNVKLSYEPMISNIRINNMLISAELFMDKSGKNIPQVSNEKVEIEEVKDDIKMIKDDIKENDTPLDSDDELEPYDMEYDVELRKEKRPKFVRDLLEALTNTTDWEVKHEAFECSHDLITSQLSDQDIPFTILLLDIVLRLESLSSVDDFEKRRFSICIAIVSTYPSECVQHLAKKFASEQIIDDITTRIRMLDIISTSAIQLSKLKNDPEFSENKTLTTCVTTDIIKQRVLLKTRRFTSATKVKPGEINRFAKLVDAFFFPLLGDTTRCPGIRFSISAGSDETSLSLEHNIYLLDKYLQTLAIIMLCAQNVPSVPRMAKELLEAVLYIRFAREPAIILGIISCVSSVILVTPQSRLKTDLLNQLNEYRSWLSFLANSLSLNPVIKENATNLLVLIDLTVQNDDICSLYTV